MYRASNPKKHIIVGGKRRSLPVLMILVISVSFFTGLVFGSDVSEDIEVYRNTITIKVNDVQVGTDNFLYKGTSYIPLRAVSELLDKEVTWNAVTKVAGINERSYQLEALSQLLPSDRGFQWRYNGFAEYGHTARLDSILDSADQRTYFVTGLLDDVSGGEGDADLSISLNYIIKDNSLIQTKEEEIMLDSKFDRLTLIQTPLVVGTYWNEEVTDEEGVTQIMSSLITEIEILESGDKEYTVRYSQQGSDYYEQRTIRENLGVVSFEKLFEFGEDSFSAGYFIYEPD